MLEWKKQADLYIMDHHPWECLMTVFSAVDLLQHYFWRYIGRRDVGCRTDRGLSDRIDTFFHTLDEILACYLERMSREDAVFLVSDHGFGPAEYVVYVNDALAREGLLQYDRHTTRRMRGLHCEPEA